jgi:hypothetical protein
MRNQETFCHPCCSCPSWMTSGSNNSAFLSSPSYSPNRPATNMLYISN